MTIFSPSTHPSSRSLCRNASSRGALSEGDVKLRKPIRGTFPACCASAASGAARRPPVRLAMNARRFIIRSPGSTPPIVDDPRPSLPGALHHLARALIEVSGRVHRVGGIAELITRLQHKVLTCHPELRHPGDEGDNQMHRMRVLAPRPPSRVGLDVNVGIPARDPLGANDVAVQGYCEFALLQGRRSTVLRLRDERHSEEPTREHANECPALHYSITWSARASNAD